MPELRTMTVRELKEALNQFNDAQPVTLASPSGDYWGTTLTLGITEIKTASVSYSTYHHSFKLPRNQNAPQDDEEVTLEVVVLS